ncbi:tyrosine-type recombinase/integrase [Luteolibacter flavescens]|uniref:Tyrosine-type recombinase/integrase n=1 Tax=Luteolibacter flavescens TaxID=1859460 RepID=A0ABT3FVV9_9BACT|nr:tyrosine-type recombinase/integrase [Luteolibacter flavescens]MCW1887726.1 tyrosine-type recombinase/integrase [Luteolibacter flavescens]
MATLYKRGKLWWARWFDHTGKRVSKSTGTDKKREAASIAAEYEAKDRKKRKGVEELAPPMQRILDAAAIAANKGALTTAKAEEMLAEIRKLANPNFKVVSLADQLTSWAAAQASRVSTSTATGYADMARHFIAAFPPKVAKAPVGDLTPQQVEAALRKIVTLKVQRTSRTIKAATANLDLRALRRALSAAVRDNLAVSNAAADVRPLPESDSVERSPFTATEVRAMLDHEKTSAEWAGMILFGAHTGLRLTDVSHLGREHIEGTDLVIRPKKTKRTRKTIRIPLTPPLIAWVEGKQGHFFPGLRERTSGTLATTFKRIMKSAGVPDKITLPGGISAVRSFHSLRHTFNTWLAEADIHADVRKALTGHSSERDHARYTHHDEALRKAITVLPDLTGTDG